MRESLPRQSDSFNLGRSNSHAMPPDQLRKLTVAYPGNQNNLLNQLDMIPNDSKYSFLETDTIHNLSDNVSSQMPKQTLAFVELKSPSVQLGLERLGRLLQIKGMQLDQVEKVVLQGQYKPE